MEYSYVDITRCSISEEKIIGAGLEYEKHYSTECIGKEIYYVMSSESFSELLSVSHLAKINKANMKQFGDTTVLIDDSMEFGKMRIVTQEKEY